MESYLMNGQNTKIPSCSRWEEYWLESENGEPRDGWG